jgi:outer membrane protein assembly factor BamE (lipoprotein component of BamABCDE complex)
MVYILSFVMLLVSSCTPKIINHGYNFDEINTDQIKINHDNKYRVMEIMGSPSLISDFSIEKKGWVSWYYYHKKVSRFSACDPKMLEQKVIRIDFDEKEIVRGIQAVDQNDSKKIEFAKEKTETTGYESGVMKDIFGNFGKKYGGK